MKYIGIVLALVVLLASCQGLVNANGEKNTIVVSRSGQIETKTF